MLSQHKDAIFVPQVIKSGLFFDHPHGGIELVEFELVHSHTRRFLSEETALGIAWRLPHAQALEWSVLCNRKQQLHIILWSNLGGIQGLIHHMFLMSCFMGVHN